MFLGIKIGPNKEPPEEDTGAKAKEFNHEGPIEDLDDATVDGYDTTTDHIPMGEGATTSYVPTEGGSVTDYGPQEEAGAIANAKGPPRKRPGPPLIL